MTPRQFLTYAEQLHRCAQQLVAARARVAHAHIGQHGALVILDDPADLPALLDQRQQRYRVQEDVTHLPRVEGVLLMWDADTLPQPSATETTDA